MIMTIIGTNLAHIFSSIMFTNMFNNKSVYTTVFLNTNPRISWDYKVSCSKNLIATPPHQVTLTYSEYILTCQDGTRFYSPRCLTLQWNFAVSPFGLLICSGSDRITGEMEVLVVMGRSGIQILVYTLNSIWDTEIKMLSSILFGIQTLKYYSIVYFEYRDKNSI